MKPYMQRMPRRTGSTAEIVLPSWSPYGKRLTFFLNTISPEELERNFYKPSLTSCMLHFSPLFTSCSTIGRLTASGGRKYSTPPHRPQCDSKFYPGTCGCPDKSVYLLTHFCRRDTGVWITRVAKHFDGRNVMADMSQVNHFFPSHVCVLLYFIDLLRIAVC